MMDLRYHLASLMSVFLALAVGIVVGVSLGSSERQAATIQNLQRDVAAIRADDSRLKEMNTELRRVLSARDTAAAELLPQSVRGRLAGNRVALLLTGETAALAAPITRTLEAAGAEVVVTVRLPREEGDRRQAGTRGSGDGDRGDDPKRDSAASAEPPSDLPGEAEATAAAVVRALVMGRPEFLTGLTARTPELTVEGELNGPVRRLLLICPNDSPEYARAVAEGRGVEVAVGRAARQWGALLVAAESEEARLAPDPPNSARPPAPVSLLPALTGVSESVVDNIETPTGQIAAVLTLAGARGHFGTGPGAARPLPPLDGP
jgi:hypothetical protein